MQGKPKTVARAVAAAEARVEREGEEFAAVSVLEFVIVSVSCCFVVALSNH